MRGVRTLGVLLSVIALVTVVDQARADGSSATPLPHATGPLGVTSASHPFNSTLFNRTPRDLRDDDYVEEEYLVDGTANVYDWLPDGSLNSIADGPYESRILVRRPVRRSHFSGNVVVEMLNPTSLHDLDIVWAAAQEHFIRNGDIWVGVTVAPSSITALKTFDGGRYSTMSMASPVAPRCTATTWPGATAETESGFAWDIVSQVGALLKSDAADNPLRRFDVEHQLLTGFSRTAGFQTTYINAIAPHVTLAHGRPIYDGHLPLAGANFPVPINQCAPRPAPGSSRWVIQPPGRVPVIALQTLSDFYALGGFSSRRPDSTGAAGNYRLYEVAGAGHIWATQVAYAPGAADLVRSGFSADWWDPYCDRPVTTFPLEYAINGAFANLTRWVERGKPAPIAERIAVTDPASPSATVVRDAYGNAVGGLRTPAIDVPRSAYFGTTPGTGTCQVLWGHEEPFSDAQLAALYPRPDDYARALKRSATSLEHDRWITKEDARALVEHAVFASRG